MKAIVVMSGGQDSMTCLGEAMKEFFEEDILAVGFNYGQKHAVELEAAAAVCAKYGIDFKVIDMRPILSNMHSSALVNHGDTTKEHRILSGLPASFVPARNALFLTAAYGLAIEAHATVIYTGVCQTDYSGYPDCRDTFIKALNNALNIGYESNISIITPLMYKTKAETFLLAKQNGMLNDVLNYSVTCYDGDNTTDNEWGYGCAVCPSCKLRAKGWAEYKAMKA